VFLEDGGELRLDDGLEHRFLLAVLGDDAFHVERVEQGVTAIYDRHSYDGEKQEALERRGEQVGALVCAGSEVLVPDETSRGV